MKKWINLNSKNPADTLALATVLSYENECYGIIRKSYQTPIFAGLPNVTVDFYPNDGDTIVKIEELDTDSWEQKCSVLAEAIELKPRDIYDVYFGFQKHLKSLEDQWGSSKKIMLYLFPHQDYPINLIEIDKLVKLFQTKGVESVSGGTNMIPCINNTYDYRNIIDLSVFCGLRDKISFVLTTEPSLKTIGEALGVTTFLINNSEELCIDGRKMLDAVQMYNYITSIIKSE